MKSCFFGLIVVPPPLHGVAARKLSLVAALMITLLLSHTHPVQASGFRTLKAQGLVVGVWYPSDAPERKGRLGPFDVELAFDASPAPGRYQPIMMSHGYNGRMRNHHLTARALADAGFIVIAPKHTPDHLIGGAQTSAADTQAFAALDWRRRELMYAIEIALQDDELREVIDLSRVHALGYSLGSVTVLAAAGAGIDWGLAEQHCARNEDPSFCESPSFFLRMKMKRLRGVKTPKLERAIPKRYFSLPTIRGGIAVIAPLGQGIIIDPDLFQARKIYVVGFSEDKVNIPKFHAQILVQIIPEDRLDDYSVHRAHHLAFIAPFASRVTDVEDIPAAKDPPGFNRLEFIAPFASRVTDVEDIPAAKDHRALIAWSSSRN